MQLIASEIDQIRGFRRSMRHFERLSQSQLRGCCQVATLAQCLVLMEVDEAGQLSVGQLASRLRLDKSTLSRTIDGLVKRRLLTRRRDKTDRRVVWIGLSPAGQTACREIHRDNDALVQRVFENIPPERRPEVRQSFDLLVQAFLKAESERMEVLR